MGTPKSLKQAIEQGLLEAGQSQDNLKDIPGVIEKVVIDYLSQKFGWAFASFKNDPEFKALWDKIAGGSHE